MTSEVLMHAILAMDSYNRGYNQGITGLGGLGSQIGNATFVSESEIGENDPGVAQSFYASAYNYDGETVIS